MTFRKMMLQLHLYLHLPQTFGMIFVSAFGALLASLIISGILAHKRIFKDAFRFRRGGNAQLEQVDLHNRLSVWASPFHLMIALTGAYFGLSGLIIYVSANAFHEGDMNAILQLAFGAEPELVQEIQLADVGTALINFEKVAPDESDPIFLTVHESGTQGQFIEIYATAPSRLIYSENYRFDIDGQYLGRDDVSDGPTGKQAIFSTYRLHFGHFGGFPVKILYVLLGLSLTVISVTGINIWLAKRKTRDYINDLWAAFVWATPLGLSIAAIGQTIFNINATALLWTSILASCGYAYWLKNESKTRKHLLLSLSGALIALVVIYSIKFWQHSFTPIALGMNSFFIAIAACSLIYIRKQSQK